MIINGTKRNRTEYSEIVVAGCLTLRPFNIALRFFHLGCFFLLSASYNFCPRFCWVIFGSRISVPAEKIVQRDCFGVVKQEWADYLWLRVAEVEGCIQITLAGPHPAWVFWNQTWETKGDQKMDGDSCGELSIDWDTDDELEVKNASLSACSGVALSFGEAKRSFPEASSSSASSNSKLIQHFVGMGFSENLVGRAIEENGEGNTELILEWLLTYSALESTNQENPDLGSIALESSCQNNLDLDDNFSSDYEGSFLQDLSDSDSCPENEVNETYLKDNSQTPSQDDKKLLFLADMGFPIEEASIALKRCGPDASVAELTDFITAAQISRAADACLPREEKPIPNPLSNKKRKMLDPELRRQKKLQGHSKRFTDEDEMLIRLPKPMIGFGIPTEPWSAVSRTLPESASAPPYFYYENVALAPKGVWQTISRFLGGIEPEFVDSKYFCAAARKRGYVHNLPIHERFPLLPLPPGTIHEALPLTKRWWPVWDKRTKLNCLQTCIGSAKLTERIRKALKDWDDVPPLKVQKYVMDECKKWNLVWVGRNKVAPLEADEVEMLLGFPRNHTRGGGISRTDRYKSLGNSFQVDTVAYHLSALKKIFASGMNVLSLFSGIGGAEVALHRLGIPLNLVVSVEISETNRNIQRCWWEQTNQKGTLVDIADVQLLTADRLEEIINTYGGFDLVIGGSPCNNLAGSNRVSRDGLEGKESSLFFDFYRILDSVRCLMGKRR